MSSGHGSLGAASNDRKARLAKLASLKRKQFSGDVDDDQAVTTGTDAPAATRSDKFLSGRNYDVETRGPKIGFDATPNEGKDTAEKQAEQIALITRAQAAKDEQEAAKGIDLFKLQPKKPNWDLKRDLNEKMKILDVQTKNAIARLVRERIANSKKEAEAQQKAHGQDATDTDDQGEEVGIDGNTLVEGVHLREREEEEEQRNREQDEQDGMV